MGRGSQIRTKKHGARKNRRTTSPTPLPEPPKPELSPLDVARTGLVKFGKVESHKLREYKRGELYNASGKRVDRPKEAISMAAHEALLEGARDVPGKHRVEKMNEALERLARKNKDAA
jgi:hypothetical protein